MRLDIPDEVPRRRATGERSSEQPLEPSPIERYREALAAIAADRHTVPHAQHNRLHQSAPPKG